ncbi:NYN domain-containing protein [Selenomonas sp. FC4001]|uniref:LabA-like NYN domain-containing protein n=1 Tax=Selenomonas sp. FC4001 TaxID=1408313 RepID=UPI000563C6FE|nr:NYN domain-containing protein [Selenomonas sp. FC4001]
MEKKLAVFMDFANVDASLRYLGQQLDPGELLHYLANEQEGRALKAAFAYVPIDPRREHAQDEIIDELWQTGYIVKSKVGTIAGESYKCNLDVEMAMDIARVAYEIKPDIVVLVSGDSDFLPIVLELREKGIRVEVASFNTALSTQLASHSSGCILLDELLTTDEPSVELASESDMSMASNDTVIRADNEEQRNFEQM